MLPFHHNSINRRPLTSRLSFCDALDEVLRGHVQLTLVLHGGKLDEAPLAGRQLERRRLQHVLLQVHRGIHSQDTERVIARTQRQRGIKKITPCTIEQWLVVVEHPQSHTK